MNTKKITNKTYPSIPHSHIFTDKNSERDEEPIVSIKKQIAAYLTIFEEDGGMNKANLHRLAREIGIDNPDQISQKTELVRAIQAISHQRPCFRSGQYMLCRDGDCIWISECKKLIAEWMR